MLAAAGNRQAGLPVIDRRHKDIAVALRHDGIEGPPPAVVAKGHGRLAGRILELARAHGIEVREDPDLVQILQQLEVGSSVPPQAFAAVAEILACLYRRNAELAAAGGSPTNDPNHDNGSRVRWSQEP